MESGVPPIQYDRCPCKRGDTDTRREVNADPRETQSDDRLQARISELTNTQGWTAAPAAGRKA